MTLIIGVLCKDSVVVAADGAATLGGLAGSTARQPVKKLATIDERVVIGVSGPVGLAQQLTDRVQTLWTQGQLKGTKCKTLTDAMRTISREFQKDVIPALKAAQAECVNNFGTGPSLI
jgi:20S proteasome alpha/beta subunit